MRMPPAACSLRPIRGAESESVPRLFCDALSACFAQSGRHCPAAQRQTAGNLYAVAPYRCRLMQRRLRRARAPRGSPGDGGLRRPRMIQDDACAWRTVQWRPAHLPFSLPRNAVRNVFRTVTLVPWKRSMAPISDRRMHKGQRQASPGIPHPLGATTAPGPRGPSAMGPGQPGQSKQGVRT